MTSEVHLLNTADDGSRTHCGLLALEVMVLDHQPPGGELCELCQRSYLVDVAEYAVQVRKAALAALIEEDQ